ncbi:MAG: 23S rRNA (uracil(1939)-C(5))-methyltransferase RlmD [Chitinophagaceae bacterium]|nr:MAG: 23S rRNA (uracil(1939)-C(5))-methyltransferase RlmD [Chitinophagaceae bacterium]
MKRKDKIRILEKIEVENYAGEGKSIARVDGKVVFIERVVPGDIVDVRLTKSKKDWAEGYPVHFHSYAKERVTPCCKHFGVCGGCQWQMLPYSQQLIFKQKQVEETLKRIGKILLPEILPIAGAETTEFYRNKLEYTFSSKEYFELPPDDNTIENMGAAGFHAKGWFDKVVEIEKCWLQAEPTNAIRNTIASFARQEGFSFYDYKSHTGFLRNTLVRICTTGEVMVNIVLGEDDMEKCNKLLKHLLETVPGITTLLYTINKKFNDSIHDLKPIVYSGKGFVIEKMKDRVRGNEFIFKIGPQSFFQTNTKQAEKLYNITMEFAELTGNEIVYDLYCGTGSIGIFISKGARKIIGVEQLPIAINDAKENAILNKISHAEFFDGDVIDICKEDFFNQHGMPDVIITDPPRAGMHEKLVQKILEIAAPIVVYVSCNPATQARDINLLDEKYYVSKIQPVDMFPHTQHIENVVQLKLKK